MRLCLTGDISITERNQFSPPKEESWRSHTTRFVLKYKLLKVMGRSSARMILVILSVIPNYNLALHITLCAVCGNVLWKSVLLLPRVSAQPSMALSVRARPTCVFSLLALCLPKEELSRVLSGSTSWACNAMPPKVPPYSQRQNSDCTVCSIDTL